MAARRVVAARCIIIAGLIAEAIVMYVDYGGDLSGMDGMMIYLCYGFVLPAFVLVNLPAWILLPRLAAKHDTRARTRSIAGSLLPPLLAIAAGIVILYGDWEKLWVLFIPTVPSVLAVTAIAIWPVRLAPRRAS